MTKVAKKAADDNSKELDNLWEDIREGDLDDLDPVVTYFTVPYTNLDTTTMKRLTNNKSVKNLGLGVQLDRQCALQLRERKEMWKSRPENSNQPHSNCGPVQNTDWGHAQPR